MCERRSWRRHARGRIPDFSQGVDETPATHSYLCSGSDDDGDGKDPQLDGGKSGVSNFHHRYFPHAPRQKLHQILILYRYRHRVVCRIDELPMLGLSCGIRSS